MDGASTYRRVLATVGFFTLAAGDFWRYLLSWWGWGAIAAVILALAIVELVRSRDELRRPPVTLVLTLAVMIASIVWSAYRLETLAGIALTLAATAFAFFVATCLSWTEIIDTLGVAMRWIIGLSLVFEVVVAAFVRRPILPLWVDYSGLDEIPRAFYWSRDLLFEGGRIQGIVGNANILAMAALIGAIVLAVQVVRGRGSRPWLVVWAIAAVATLVLTRSSTVILAAVAAVLVGLVVLLARRGGPRGRWMVPAVALGGAGAIVGLAIAFRGPLLALLGRSEDLTNRLDIWAKVTDLAGERPFAGWGWIGYWAPWVPPFEDLAVIRGVTYLQAHNAWLDVFLQLGVLGLVVVGLLVLTTVARSWAFAIDGPPAIAAFPIVLLGALLVQSIAESRLLIEIGWALLVIVAVRSTVKTEEA